MRLWGITKDFVGFILIYRNWSIELLNLFEPPDATSSRYRPVFKNTKSFPVITKFRPSSWQVTSHKQP